MLNSLISNVQSIRISYDTYIARLVIHSVTKLSWQTTERWLNRLQWRLWYRLVSVTRFVLLCTQVNNFLVIINSVFKGRYFKTTQPFQPILKLTNSFSSKPILSFLFCDISNNVNLTCNVVIRNRFAVFIVSRKRVTEQSNFAFGTDSQYPMNTGQPGAWWYATLCNTMFYFLTDRAGSHAICGAA